MKSYPFNEGWKYRRLHEEEWTAIILPHDAMLCERRTKTSASGVHGAWFEGYDYEYVNAFYLPREGEGRVYIFEFEGVYRNAEVYLNGKQIAFHAYGYTGFFVPVTEQLKFGQENELRVIARNADQPNSRWYSGAGIYRPVWLHVAQKEHVLCNGIQIRTLSLSPARVEVCVETTGKGKLSFEVLDGKSSLLQAETACGEEGKGKIVLTLESALPWSPSNPKLYALRVRFGEDVATQTFGIRTLSLSAERGFELNGERIILQGACIHHDNGILGARCFDEAERRKIRLLKAAGYNAIRSAHNPCSKALVRACDELGMLVVDEYADGWYIHKTKYDYSSNLTENYAQDIADMIKKDYNHPSVIMYSLGNEVAETASPRGVELYEKMQSLCHELDGTRAVTVGVNIFFNLLYSLGFGVYSDEKAEKTPKKKVGSEFFNALAGKLGASFMKRMATLRACDRKTRAVFSVADVAGYNYGVYRYEKDIKKYPNRIILGTETFCADAPLFSSLAQKYPAVIGDFVWAGMDYLGEVGVGSWEYRDYAPDFSHGVGWISAGSGRINLIGTASGEALFTRVAFGLEGKPRIAVRPVNHTGERHSPSSWKFSNALPSWSWHGCEGKRAVVEVYSRAPVIKLLLNGKTVGKKKNKGNCRVLFRTRYEAGRLTAIACDKNGKELVRHSLYTAEEKTVLSVLPEQPTVRAEELCFIRLRYTDEKGELKPLVRGKMSVKVTGGKLLALGNACPYNREGYCSNETDSYFGEALAVVRAGRGAYLLLECEGYGLFGGTKIPVLS